MAADSDGDCDICLPFGRLNALVKSFKGRKSISISQEKDGKGHITLKSGQSRFKLPTLPAADMPEMKEATEDTHFSVRSDDLRSWISKSVQFATTDELRPYLHGISLQSEDKTLTISGCNGHSLAKIVRPAPLGAEAIPDTIIHRPTCLAILKILPNEVDVDISLGKATISLTFDDLIYTARLVDGVFPDINRIIPADNGNIYEVQCEAFKQAVGRVSHILSGADKLISSRVALSFKKTRLSISAENSGAEGEDIVACKRKSGDDVSIVFNLNYLLIIAEAAGTDTLIFHLPTADEAGSLNNSAAAKVMATNNDDDLFVVMPMRA
ncbi:MAG: hypothetical protein V7727_00265, partial [Sneathiella sp.]